LLSDCEKNDNKQKEAGIDPFFNLAVQNVFYIQLYMESAFTHNPWLTGIHENDIKRMNEWGIGV